jgi:putative CocE/NonD family hydrolase
VAFVLVFLAATPFAVAQQIDFPQGAAEDEAALAAAMPAFAEQVIAKYANENREQYLDNLGRLQIVAGKYAEGRKTLAALREARPSAPLANLANVRWEIYANAREMEAGGKPFDEAFRQAFRETMRSLDDANAYRVLWSFGTALGVLEGALRGALDRHKGATSMPIADAVDLVRKYLSVQAFRSFQPSIAELMNEDDARRYIIAKDVAVKTPEGATICAVVVRPRAEERHPAILNFTIYADSFNNLNEARRTASNGYVGVVGLPRGKGCSPDKPVPYEHDSADAAALIDWIAAQPWSNGRVGMYGGSYEGFAVWAAAKRMPKALKSMMAGAPVAPGIDVPMEGNVFWNFVYPWPFYTTNTKMLDDATYNDNDRWNKLNHDWYVSGRAYRDLEKIDKTPNPVFDRWIAHASYDHYWQDMIPYKTEFARIDIPVLSTAGYYFGGPGAAVYYFTQHYRYRPNAEHYLVIGPYDHVPGHRGTISVLGTSTMTTLAGYELDPVAQLDMAELRYQWFDYTLKNGRKPPLLKDKVNYEVMGANVWKHAPSLAAMANQTLRFHLTAARSGDSYKLSGQKPTAASTITQTVNLADRTDVDRQPPGGGVLDKALDTSNGIAFISDTISTPTELSGLFAGRLDFITNKKDFDFQITLFELTSTGDYVQLAPYWSRASYAANLSHRHLLTPRKRQHIDFKSTRLMGRQLQPGSKLVVVLQVIKETGRQINYGTGRDVSDETIADAKEPLRIQWLSSSYVDLPVWR